MSKVIDISGQRFGRLLVIGGPRIDHGRQAYWRCRCDCGAVKDVASRHLRAGVTRSCGCLIGETAAKRSRKHGNKSRSGATPEYDSWCNMKQRCTNLDHKRFKDWGGRGITVCDEWANDFNAFLSDMGPRPCGCTLDRIDNDGPYAPWNCRWATAKQQRENTREREYPSGETHHNARLTTAVVVAIRSRHAAGESMASLARDFGVNLSTVSRAVLRETWKHVA